MMFIENTNDLKNFCNSLKNKDFITVDLEFIREKTYWAKLCLIQIGAIGTEACVDPLSKKIDLSPVFELMKNEKITKVFHAGRQDLEIFYNLMGTIPKPIFDTQVAAMVCGFGESVGYQTLVSKIAKKQIDKTMRFSNWEKRPLSKKQIEYALSDVTHLREIYKYLKNRLQSTRRTHWLDEEMETLTCKETYEVKPYEAWHRIKARSHNRRFLAILRELASLREELALQKNLTRKLVVRDEVLTELAASAPLTKEKLEEIRGLPHSLLKGETPYKIIDAIKKAKALPEEELPKKQKHKEKPKGAKNIEELLKVFLNIKASEEDVAPKIVATKKDIEKIAIDDNADVPALKGWRRDIFGKEALDLKNGKTAIGFDIEEKRLKIIDIENELD